MIGKINYTFWIQRRTFTQFILFQTSEHTSVEHTTEVREVGQKRELVYDAFGRNAPSCLGSSNTSQNGCVVPMVSSNFGRKVTEFHITIGLTGGVWG